MPLNLRLLPLLVIFLCATSKFASAQSISPSTDDEYCPNVNTPFKVTIIGFNPHAEAGLRTSVITPASNITIKDTVTTFTFVGKFADANATQSFRIVYTNTKGKPADYYVTFNKIKSLLFNTNCALILGVGGITAPRCQVSNFNIAFNNVHWGNASTTDCFGTDITNYEYLLPIGWSIGSTVSNGSNWIAGSSNVTVTSDLSHGDGAAIQIRPVNSCATGLANNQPPVLAPISRPAPVLRILGPADGICYNDFDMFTVIGIPSGATVQWSVDDPSEANLTDATSATVTLRNITTNHTFVNLTATVTDCSSSYTVTKQVQLGALYSTYNIIAHYPSTEGSCFQTFAFHYFEAIYTGGFAATQFQWSYRLTGTIPETSVAGTSSIAGPFLFNDPGNYDIIVRTGNQCGLAGESIRTINVCDGLGGVTLQSQVAVSPNPVKSELTVTIAPTVQKNVNPKISGSAYIYFELIQTGSGKTVRQWKLLNNQQQYKLNVSGIYKGMYYLITKMGNTRMHKQIMID